MLRTAFTDLVGCTVPIQLAAMGSVGSAELAVAVSRAGGFGMVPGPQPVERLGRLRDQTGGSFGVNLLMPFVDRTAVEMAAGRAKLIEFFYGAPDASLIEAAHSGGALACWQVGSREEAVRAATAGCDVLVAQGREAGGHVRGQLGLLTVLCQVLDAVEVPVLAAGGIGTARAMAAALAAGAARVRVGTQFVAARESGAHPRYVDALIAASADDTVVTETFSTDWPHAPHRVLRSSVEAATANQEEPVGRAENGWAIPRLHPTPPNRRTTGHIEAMALYAGESQDFPLNHLIRDKPEGLYNGGSGIIASDGSWVVERVVGEERLIIAEIDPAQVHAAHYTSDPTGHYSRPDVFTVTLDRRRQEAASFADAAEDALKPKEVLP